MKNFYITGLPRSRTAWFSSLFNAHGIRCYHEAMNCQSKNEYREAMSAYSLVGNSDCGLVFNDIMDEFPGPVVVVRRSINDVFNSLRNKGCFIPASKLMKYDALLDSISGLHVKYEDIDDNVEFIFDFLVGSKPDRRIVRKLQKQNIQRDIPEHIEKDLWGVKEWLG